MPRKRVTQSAPIGAGQINGALKQGDKVTADVFAIGDAVDVIGISKGKGFQGAIKRYHFNRQPKTHGAVAASRCRLSRARGNLRAAVLCHLAVDLVAGLVP